ncbi:MAG: efflux RND transporter periplasmic adaptor subunit [Clostridiales bacterium]|nr:efflux RND transporter periplasmic adaptor subunit [Clostridiales bacterium]MCF8023363.1 efflux RND transporter periplasmic adaptor subunit [Clostridiales bacterium]
MRFRTLLLIILSVSLLAAGCGKQPEENNSAEKTVPVEVVKAQKDKLQEINVVSGKLEAVSSSDVVPGGAGGKVESIKVETGDKVWKGQTLVVLENNTLAAAVKQAEYGVAQVKSALESAEIDFKQAKKNYERGQKLFKQGAISKSVFESKYENPYKKAKINFEKTQPAALEKARAGLEQAKESYQNSIVAAPISGTVTAVNVNPGELASPQSPLPVVSIAMLDKVEVEAGVAGDLVNNLSTGDEVQVDVSAVPGGPFAGKVTSISPAADQQSKSFPVEVELDNPEHKLKPGMFAEINFVREHDEHIVVPREAVSGSGGENAAWVIKNGTAHKRQVELGPGNSDSIIVLSGIHEGDRVVVVGSGSLKDGNKVKIKGQVAANENN